MARVLTMGSVALLVAVAACGGSDGGDGGTTGPAVFTTLEIEPATVSVTPNGGTQTLTARALDQNGAAMSGLTVTYTSSDESKATVTNAGVVTGVAAGTATITATGTVGTVQKTKTVNATVASPGQAATVQATVSNSFTPSSVTIAPGGQVTWTFAALHNVQFSGTGAPANITDRSTGSESRTFPTAGTYNYICGIHGAGMSGTVRVQ